MPPSKTDLSSLSTQELLEAFAAELARRRAAQVPAEDMSTMEMAFEAEAEELKHASLARRLEQRGNEEDDHCKACQVGFRPLGLIRQGAADRAITERVGEM